MSYIYIFGHLQPDKPISKSRTSVRVCSDRTAVVYDAAEQWALLLIIEMPIEMHEFAIVEGARIMNKHKSCTARLRAGIEIAKKYNGVQCHLSQRVKDSAKLMKMIQ